MKHESLKVGEEDYRRKAGPPSEGQTLQDLFIFTRCFLPTDRLWLLFFIFSMKNFIKIPKKTLKIFRNWLSRGQTTKLKSIKPIPGHVSYDYRNLENH